MKKYLENLLICPLTQKPLQTIVFIKDNNDIIDGLLIAQNGNVYPIVNSIPRMLPDALSMFPKFVEKYREKLHQYNQLNSSHVIMDEKSKLKKRTQKTFGYQWNQFPDMVEQNRNLFMTNYSSVPSEFYKGKLGLDAGCGFGRHIYYAAELGAEMVGIDYSSAIDAAAEVTRGIKNIHLVQGDIYHSPFANDTFDFFYSFGVLHHLPDPLKGFCSLLPKVKKGGAAFVWLYGKQRKYLNAILESMRFISKRLSMPILKPISFVFALIDYSLLIIPYKYLNPILSIDKIFPVLKEGRFSIYTKLPFRVTYADWFDRFSPPLRYYFNENDLKEWIKEGNLNNARIEST